jgi:ribonuclease HI/exonuclease III
MDIQPNPGPTQPGYNLPALSPNYIDTIRLPVDQDNRLRDELLLYFPNLFTVTASLYSRICTPTWGLALYQAIHVIASDAIHPHTQQPDILLTLETQLMTSTILTFLHSQIQSSLAGQPCLLILLERDLVSHRHHLLPPDAAPIPTSASSTSMTFVTWNIRSLKRNVHGVQTLISSLKPTVLILTETWLNTHDPSSTWLKETFKEYATIESAHPSQIMNKRLGYTPSKNKRAGVLLAIHNEYAHSDLVTQHRTSDSLHGHLIHASINIPDSTPLHIFAVYNPCNQGESSHARIKIFQYIQECRQEYPSDRFILGGDWNATSEPRQHQGAADHMYHTLLNSMQFSSVFSRCPGPRPPSHDAGYRIDDFICSTTDPLLDYLASQHTTAWPPEVSTQPEYAYVSDHRPVIFHCPRHVMLESPPPAPQPHSRRDRKTSFIRPFKLSDLNNFKSAVDARLQHNAHELCTSISTILADQGPTPTATITSLIASSIQYLESIYAIAKSTLPQATPPPPTLQTNRPPAGNASYLPRCTAARFTRLIKLSKYLRTTIATLEASPTALTDLRNDITTKLYISNKTIPHIKQNTTAASYIEALKNKRLDTKAKFKNILKTHQCNLEASATKRLIKLYYFSRRLTHQTIFGKQNSLPPTGHIVHPITGQRAHTNTEMLHATEVHHRLMASTHAPIHQTTRPPWELDTSPDCMGPLQQRGHPETPLETKLTMDLYLSCLKNLKNGKSAGDDGIPYEILKHLPQSAHQLIYSLFTLMWRNGTTPDLWKTCMITLLPKKAPLSDPNNYRPIGVHVTIYKLWTRVVTQILSNYVEAYGILSHGQDGFRPERGTRHALQLFTLALEDAKHHKHNLFTTTIDFSQAYNSIDHTRLFHTMSQLGIPQDAINVVRSVYANATTTIRTDWGDTAPFPTNRGVIQGDTLSPLLYNLATEPLLRWLDSNGKRGYTLGCTQAISDKSAIPPNHLRIAAFAFADDIKILADTNPESQTQLTKVELFSDWAEMRPAHTETNCKCDSSAILWADAAARTDPADTQLLTSRATSKTRVRHSLHTLRLHNKPLQIMYPTEPAKYLGVWFTLTLNFKAQFEKTLEDIMHKAECLATCKLTAKQKLQSEEECILGSLQHSFTVTPYTAKQLKEFQKVRTSLIKKIHGLPNTSATAPIYAPRESFGMGHTSLFPLQAQICSATLTEALNDTGRLGTATRARLALLQATGTITINPNPVAFGNLETTMNRAFCSITKKHKAILSYGLVPTYSTLTPNGPAHKCDLWKFISDANRSHNHGMSDAFIFQYIAIPLWRHDIIYMSHIIHPTHHRILTAAELTTTRPEIDSSALQALELLVGILCQTSFTLPTDWNPPTLLPTWELPSRRIPARYMPANPPNQQPPPPTDTTPNPHPMRTAPTQTPDTRGIIPPFPVESLPRNKIVISTEELNPEVDTTATDTYELYHCNNLIWAHLPNGHCIGTIHPERLSQLYARYYTNSTNPTLPHFKQSICVLLLAHYPRYMDIPAMKKISAQIHSLPPSLTQALHGMAPYHTEWLTDSLHCNIKSNQIMSPDPSCNPFGAGHNPYLYKWTGCGLVHPHHTDHDICKALKHATLSASTTNIPTLLIFCAPTLDTRHSAHKLYNHPNTHMIASLPAHSWLMVPILHWTGRDAKQHRLGKPFSITLIANREGIIQYLQPNGLGNLEATLSTICSARPILTTDLNAWRSRLCNPGPPAPEPSHQIIPSKTFQNATTLQPQLQSLHPPEHPPILELLPTTRHLRFADTNTIYTDGSKHADSGNIGSGVYTAYDSKTYSIRHIGHAPQLNTVPRAESIGPLLALTQIAPPGMDVVIFTDSLTWIHQIRRSLYNTSSFNSHKNKAAVNGALYSMLSRPGRTAIYKTRAHIGVDGNEKADAAAKAAADPITTRTPSPTHIWIDYSDATTAEPASLPTWISYPTKPPGAIDQEYRSFDELRHQPKRYATEVYSRHVVTTADPESTFGKLIAQASTLEANENPIDTASLAYPFTASSVPHYHVQLAMQFRFRTFMTAARAHRINPTTNPSLACPLCDYHTDSIGHFLGGCTHRRIKEMICLRHGKAVTIISKALKKGNLGNCPIFTDAEGGERNARHLPPYIPRPQGASLPDILLVTGIDNIELAELDPNLRPASIPMTKRKIIIIELGYTVDTKIQEKIIEKNGQHDALIRSLTTSGWEVDLHIIPITYSGILIKSIKTTLTTCGATRPDTVIHRLIRHTLSYLQKFKAKRRFLLEERPYPQLGTPGQQPEPG